MKTPSSTLVAADWGGFWVVYKLLGSLLERAIRFLNWFELGFLGFDAVQVGFRLKGANSKVEVGEEVSCLGASTFCYRFFVSMYIKFVKCYIFV
ncbi:MULTISPECIES: hypothetical protein [Trichocoleus]|uniref:hypothetical protein n=1 Tax=Trichocoleus TaxID=450526 RepID=UPI001A7F0DF5|nr:hypothetical protein [Trichocoleus sp. FACHB-46]